MPALVQVEYENEDRSWSSLWLCTMHAERFQKSVERDERRAGLRLPRPPGGQAKRSKGALERWANVNTIEEVLTDAR
jgi:hypothetical protein